MEAHLKDKGGMYSTIQKDTHQNDSPSLSPRTIHKQDISLLLGEVSANS